LATEPHAHLLATTKFPHIPTQTKKISVLCIIICPFPLSNIDSVFTCITSLYTTSSIVTQMYMLLLNHFTFLCFNCFYIYTSLFACIYLAYGLQYLIEIIVIVTMLRTLLC